MNSCPLSYQPLVFCWGIKTSGLAEKRKRIGHLSFLAWSKAPHPSFHSAVLVVILAGFSLIHTGVEIKKIFLDSASASGTPQNQRCLLKHRLVWGCSSLSAFTWGLWTITVVNFLKYLGFFMITIYPNSTEGRWWPWQWMSSSLECRNVGKQHSHVWTLAQGRGFMKQDGKWETKWAWICPPRVCLDQKGVQEVSPHRSHGQFGSDGMRSRGSAQQGCTDDVLCTKELLFWLCSVRCDGPALSRRMPCPQQSHPDILAGVLAGAVPLWAFNPLKCSQFCWRLIY